MNVTDVRDELPIADIADRIGFFAPKTSITVHWNGPPIPRDVDPLEVILGDAHYHISKDWSPAPGIQGGDGIMYHFLIAPDGTVFKTRDDDAVLYHCGNAIGNERSYAVQVMVGGDGSGVTDPGTPVTDAQYAALGSLIAFLDLDEVKPHRAWSLTACPGWDLADWVLRRGWEFDMDETALRKILKEELHTAIYGEGDKQNPPKVTGIPLALVHVGRRILRRLDPGTPYPNDNDPIT